MFFFSFWYFIRSLIRKRLVLNNSVLVKLYQVVFALSDLLVLWLVIYNPCIIKIWVSNILGSLVFLFVLVLRKLLLGSRFLELFFVRIIRSCKYLVNLFLVGQKILCRILLGFRLSLVISRFPLFVRLVVFLLFVFVL